MNILLICKRFYTSHDLILDRFGRLYHFPRNWANRGHSINVVAMNYRKSHNESVTEENLTLQSCSIYSLQENFFFTIRRIISEKKPDVIIASGDSHIGYIGSRLAEKLTVPFVFDLYHNYEDFGTNRLPGMKWMYRRALEKSDLVVCDSEPLRNLVASRCRRTLVAQQATDKTLFRPMDKIQCRIDLGLNVAETLLVYVGSIDSRFDHNAVMGALDELTKEGIDVQLLIAGPYIDTGTTQHPRVLYLGNLPQRDIPKVIASADVCLIPYKSTALSETCNPCKLSEYIACERPIVSSNVSNIQEYLPKTGHLSYLPGDRVGLTQSLLKQIKTPDLEDPESAFSWSAVADVYLSEIYRIKGSSSH